MNDDEWACAERYFRTVADRLGLGAWGITLSREPCGENRSASCEIAFGSHRATIHLMTGWRKRTLAEQRDDVVHELIHAHLSGADNVLLVDMKTHVNPAVYTALWDNYERWSEFAVDGLSAAIAPLLPLPEWEPAEGAAAAPVDDPHATVRS